MPKEGSIIATQRKRNAYAKSYFCQTDGSAALQDMAVDDSRAASAPSPGQKPKPFMLIIPGWALVLLVSILVFVLAFVLLNMSSTASQVQKRIYALRQELERSQEIMQSLEVQLSAAEAPERIHSIAVNRLGMHQPLESEINIIPRVDYSDHSEAMEPPPKEGGGIFHYLLSMIGL